jgi:hypothetical protein
VYASKDSYTKLRADSVRASGEQFSAAYVKQSAKTAHIPDGARQARSGDMRAH